MRRIVSLVPSLTETVCELGLRAELVGATKFCVEPKGLHHACALVGGTKDPDLAQIAALKPTHVLVNEEENKPAHIAELARSYPTLATFPKSPRDVPAMLAAMGDFLAVAPAAARLAQEIERELEILDEGTRVKRQAVYYIWREPYMVCADDTYIAAMMRLYGYENAVKDAATRYPELTVPEAKALKPDVLLLSTEPYPFRKRDVERLLGEWGDRPPLIMKADGRLFSWYGSATLQALRAPEGLVSEF